MSTVERNKLKLAYEGSVKRVWQCPWQDDSLLFEFTDDYSIFDWGKMPDTIENKGRALAVFGAYFFERLSKPEFWQWLTQQEAPQHLCREFLSALSASKTMQTLQTEGLSSHYQGLVDQSGEHLSLSKAARLAGSVYMQVQKALVQRPHAVVVLNQNVFHYPEVDHSAKTRLIPLEVVFRFGLPAGSSLTERLKKDPSYAATLGLKKQPQEREMFERPLLEFYTKLEPKDRLLSVQEAMLISGLSAEQFCELVERAQASCLALYYLFWQAGIELWDGKFEFVLCDGKILLADSIGPDELRLLYKGTHLSKEMIRQVYRGSSWESALKQAQKLAKERCSLDWKGICQRELNEQPEPLNQPARDVLNKLYGVLANSLSGEELFEKHHSLDEFAATARANGL